jgi:RNA polymerase sigma factor (sigma-70 family)
MRRDGRRQGDGEGNGDERTEASECPTHVAGDPAPSAVTARLARLVEAKAQVLRFLERRLGDRAAAEDVLQTAFLRLLDREAGPHDDERLVPWFFQVLRNLLIDDHRRRAARDRGRAAFAAETPVATDPDEALVRSVCACVGELAATLRPAYAEALRLVEVDGEPLPAVAQRLGLTPNALAVRLHRSRRALRHAVLSTCRACAMHGCLDCTCSSAPGKAAAVMTGRVARLPGRRRTDP